MCYARLDRDFYFLYGVVFVFILAPAGFHELLLLFYCVGNLCFYFLVFLLVKCYYYFIKYKRRYFPHMRSDLNRVRYSGNIVFSLGCCGWKDTDVSLNTKE